MYQFIINIILLFNRSKVIRNKRFLVTYKHKLLNCINSCKTEDQLDHCEDMLDNMYKRFDYRYFSDIRDALLDKKIELM